jgi:hypothetical protein
VGGTSAAEIERLSHGYWYLILAFVLVLNGQMDQSATSRQPVNYFNYLAKSGMHFALRVFSRGGASGKPSPVEPL